MLKIHLCADAPPCRVLAACEDVFAGTFSGTVLHAAAVLQEKALPPSPKPYLRGIP